MQADKAADRASTTNFQPEVEEEEPDPDAPVIVEPLTAPLDSSADPCPSATDLVSPSHMLDLEENSHGQAPLPLEDRLTSRGASPTASEGAPFGPAANPHRLEADMGRGEGGLEIRARPQPSTTTPTAAGAHVEALPDAMNLPDRVFFVLG